MNNSLPQTMAQLEATIAELQAENARLRQERQILIMPMVDHFKAPMSPVEEGLLEAMLHQMCTEIEKLLAHSRRPEDIKRAIRSLGKRITSLEKLVKAQDAFLMRVEKSFIEQHQAFDQIKQMRNVETLPQVDNEVLVPSDGK